MVTAIALHLRNRGVREKFTLALDVENPIMAIALSLAAGALGALWVHATREALNSEASPVNFLVTDQMGRHFGMANVLYVDADWLKPPAGHEPTPSLTFEGFNQASQTFMIAQSSGTTGTLKLMAISAENAASRSDPANLLDQSDVPVVASYFHPLHQGNMWNILRVLRKGGMYVCDGTLTDWAKAGATYVIGSPAHYLLDRDFILAQKAPSLENAWIGGGPIYAAQLNDLLRLFKSVHVTYGASEVGIVSAKKITRSNWTDGPTKLGQIDERCALQVVDDRRQEVSTGGEGLLRMRAPWLVTGYLGDKDATARFFQDGWYYTGDIGYLDEHSELVVTGRASDAVNIGGTKVNLSLVDEVITSHPHVRDAVSFIEKTPDGYDRLAALVMLDDGTDDNAIFQHVSAQISEKLGKSRTPARYYRVTRIPRNANGKALRALATGSVIVAADEPR